MGKILNIEEALEGKVKRLEEELQEIDDKFDQTMARMEIKEKNGTLNENDLQMAIKALKEFREDGDEVNNKLIEAEKKINQRKSST